MLCRILPDHRLLHMTWGSGHRFLKEMPFIGNAPDKAHSSKQSCCLNFQKMVELITDLKVSI